MTQIEKGVQAMNTSHSQSTKTVKCPKSEQAESLNGSIGRLAKRRIFDRIGWLNEEEVYMIVRAFFAGELDRSDS